MLMQQRNTLSMYVTRVGKSGNIMVCRFKATFWHYSSCSWLAVSCCLVSNSLLCCWLSDYHSMLAASKQRSIHQPLPLSRTQEKFHILPNQHHFLCLLILRVPPLGVADVIRVLLACHDRGVWLTLFCVLYGCMAMRPG